MAIVILFRLLFIIYTIYIQTIVKTIITIDYYMEIGNFERSKSDLMAFRVGCIQFDTIHVYNLTNRRKLQPPAIDKFVEFL